ncbi:DEKNAAC102672 [Brettanomyces naardenensis]|uniref:DEKNAAC102672 n=1 Tax=Brettanomyces naardenensis TaxID=13370 RepID=A0A448YL79_BRENA|nr:DEKNAAC102672 [Brettanomyces naardenensis]
MNIFNALPVSFTGDNGGSGRDLTDSGPRVLYFAILDPSLIDPAHSESNEEAKRQIIIYLNFEDREVDENQMLKQVGLVQGLNDFSLKFLSDSLEAHLTHIDTDKTRIVVDRFEGSYWFICGFRLSRHNGRFTQRGLASPAYLINEIKLGYKLWFLNYGYLAEFCRQNKQKDFLSTWWRTWIQNRFEFSSSFGLNDKGFLNLLPGRRLSSVKPPIGFTENLNGHIEEFLHEEPDLIDLLVINSNWTPSKNYGVLYAGGESSPIEDESITDLVNYLERLDSNFGLSTFSLKSTNLPSLKEYLTNLKDLDSISNGQLYERSLMKPAIYLQGELTTHILNPFMNALNTMASYIPPASSFVPNFSGNYQAAERSVDVPPSLPTQTPADEAIDADSSGKFLLGNTKDETISNRKIYLKTKGSNGLAEVFNLIMYETNGILMVLFFKEDSQMLTETTYYQRLREKLNNLYEIYFKDLVIRQLEALEADLDDQDGFYHVTYDSKRKTYKTSFPNIPDEKEVRELKVFGVGENIKSSGSRLQMINLNINIMNYLLNDTKILNFEGIEKIVELGKRWWCLLKHDGDVTIVILKRCNQRDLRTAFGPDVVRWYARCVS